MGHTVGATIIRMPRVFPCKQVMQIESHGNKMHQIVQNMLLSRGLELKLSLL